MNNYSFTEYSIESIQDLLEDLLLNRTLLEKIKTNSNKMINIFFQNIL